MSKTERRNNNSGSCGFVTFSLSPGCPPEPAGDLPLNGSDVLASAEQLRQFSNAMAEVVKNNPVHPDVFDACAEGFSMGASCADMALAQTKSITNLPPCARVPFVEGMRSFWEGYHDDRKIRASDMFFLHYHLLADLTPEARIPLVSSALARVAKVPEFDAPEQLAWKTSFVKLLPEDMRPEAAKNAGIWSAVREMATTLTPTSHKAMTTLRDIFRELGPPPAEAGVEGIAVSPPVGLRGLGICVVFEQVIHPQNGQPMLVFGDAVGPLQKVRAQIRKAFPYKNHPYRETYEAFLRPVASRQTLRPSGLR